MLYDFYCSGCMTKVELKMTMKEHGEKKDSIECPKCHSKMIQKVAPLRFTLAGHGWYNDGYNVTQAELDGNLNESERLDNSFYDEQDKEKNIKEI